MGPILFGALLVIVWRARRTFSALPESDRLLLAFSVPVIALITTQAFLSRAHANWAAYGLCRGRRSGDSRDDPRRRLDLAEIVARHSTRLLPS